MEQLIPVLETIGVFIVTYAMFGFIYLFCRLFKRQLIVLGKLLFIIPLILIFLEYPSNMFAIGGWSFLIYAIIMKPHWITG